MWSSAGSGTYAANEVHVAIYGNRWKFDQARRGVLWCHNAGGSAETALTGTVGQPESVKLLADRGIPVCAVDMGGAQNWGGPTAMSRMTDAWTFMKNVMGVKTDKVILHGVSMGGIGALRWAKANPTLVAAIIGEIPEVNLQWVHDNGGAAAVEAAYGGVPNYATDNPSANPSSYTSFPIKFWYSSDDTTAPASEITSFASAVGSNVQLKNFGAAGHTLTGRDPAEVLDFVRAYV